MTYIAGSQAWKLYISEPNIRKLCLSNPILLKITLSIMKALLARGSSISKLIRALSLILSFHVPSNFLAATFTCKSALRFVGWGLESPYAVILVKKSALNNWSYNGLKLSLTIRLSKLMRCPVIRILILKHRWLSCIECCYSVGSLLVNLNRPGIPLISATRDFYILSFGLTFLYSRGLSTKRINPSGPIRIFLIRALIGS